MQVVAQFFPPKAKWTQVDVPDQTGRVVIVTGTWVSHFAEKATDTTLGGNNGIGKETVKVRTDIHVALASIL